MIAPRFCSAIFGWTSVFRRTIRCDCCRLWKGCFSRHSITRPQIIDPGRQLSMIDGAPRSASVTALRDSKLYFVSQADFDAIGKSSPEIYRDVMKMLARRLRDTNDALAASSFL